MSDFGNAGSLQRIRLKGFLSIREMDLELKPLNLLIGPNGAGKSNVIRFFRFINKLLEKDLHLHLQQQGGADRVQQWMPRYKKPLHGPQIIALAGLPIIRALCPRFDAWIARLQHLGQGATA